MDCLIHIQGFLNQKKTDSILRGTWVNEFGKGEIEYLEGDKYEGDLCLSFPHGYGIISYLDGKSFQGKFNYSIPYHGSGTYINKYTMDIMEGTWKFGRCTGSIRYSNGQLFLGDYSYDMALKGEKIFPEGFMTRICSEENQIDYLLGFEYFPDHIISFKGEIRSGSFRYGRVRTWDGSVLIGSTSLRTITTPTSTSEGVALPGLANSNIQEWFSMIGRGRDNHRWGELKLWAASNQDSDIVFGSMRQSSGGALSTIRVDFRNTLIIENYGSQIN